MCSISGSSDGLGLMAARLLVDGGHEVTLHARNPARAEDARRSVPQAKAVTVGDLSRHEKFQTKHRRRLADYSYCHVMELALTLSLRVYHVVPDSVLREVIHYRSPLFRLYRKAYRNGAVALGHRLPSR